MNKVRLSYILFLICSVMTYGQVFLSTEVSSKVTTTRDVISLTIVKEISGEDAVEDTPLRFPDLSKFETVGSGSEQNTFIDPVRKVRINQLIYQLLLVPKQAGVVKIGSVLIDVNGKTYKTEPFDILVKEAGRKALDQNASIANQIYLNVKLNENTVYKNEPVVAVLRAFTKDVDNFRRIKNITTPKTKDILVQNINYTKSDIEPDVRPGMLSQIIGMFVIFPKEDGRVDVPPFSAEINDNATVKITSNRTSINVKSLPEDSPEDYNEFVGDFSLVMTNVEKIPQPIEINKPIDVVVKLIGKGNLSVSKMPKIKKSEDYDFFAPKLVKNLKVEKNGIVGSIEAHYILVPKRQGNIEIKTEKLSFFNPIKKEYFDLGEKNIVIHAKTPEQIASTKTTVQKVNEYTNTVLDKVNTPVLETQNLKINPKKNFNWEAMLGNLFLIGFLITLYFAARSYYNKRKYKALQKAINKSNKEQLLNIEETEKLIRDNSGFEIDTHIDYLEKLNNQEKYKEFFAEFIEMQKEVDQHFINTKGENFLEFTTTNRSQQLEDYNLLLVKIEEQKYSPIPDKIEMNKIVDMLKKVYSEIDK